MYEIKIRSPCFLMFWAWFLGWALLVQGQDVITASPAHRARILANEEDMTFVKISPQQVFTIGTKDSSEEHVMLPDMSELGARPPPHPLMFNEHMQQNPYFMSQIAPPPPSRYVQIQPKPKPKSQKHTLHRPASGAASYASSPDIRPLTPPHKKKKNGDLERSRPEAKRYRPDVSASTLSKTTLDTNLFPQHTSPESSLQIKAIDVQCAKKAMHVRIQFEGIFEGTIYSKGHFSDHSCRYVAPESHGKSYEFVVLLDKCGTNFVDAGDVGGQTYLENTLIVQNEAMVQEIGDTARRIRCLWTGQLDKRVSSNMKIDALDVVAVTYSGDTVESFMDIQLGRGPHAPPVTGLVKIGETLTMIISIHGAEDHDVRVKDCQAHDGDPKNTIQMTDVNGCVLKRKLMGPWQKTKTPSSDGSSSSVLAYSYFQAFKFPDKMEVYLECNIEICKRECPAICEEDHYGKTRSRRSKSVLVAGRASTTVNEPVEPVRLLRGIRVVSHDDIAVSGRTENGTISLTKQFIRSRSELRRNGMGNVCMSTPSFVSALVAILLILILACLMTAALCLRVRSNHRTARNKRMMMRR